MSEPNPTPTPAPAPTPEPEKVILTREELDSLIKSEFGKGKRLGSEGATVSKAQQARLDELERFHAERTAADKKVEEERAVAKGDFEKARQQIIDSAADAERKKWEPEVTRREEAIAKLRAKFQGSLRDKLLAAAAPKAYNAGQVADLLEGRRVRLNDDLEPEVLNEHGEPALVAGQPMTVDQLVDDYLAANPNLVKASGKPGGAGGGASFKSATPSELQTLEAAVDDLAARFKQTGDRRLLGEHRDASKRLAEARQKAASK